MTAPIYKAFYESTQLLGYPLFALMFFVAFFAIVVASVFRRQRSNNLDSLARMPLDDGEGTSHGR